MLESGISADQTTLNSSTAVLTETLAGEPDAHPLSGTARREFQATLQLLAARATFRTAASGVAIAMPEGKSLSYCAAVGPVPPIGTAVKEGGPAHRCMEDGLALRIPEGDGRFKLFVPVLRDDDEVGFFELVSQYEFSDQDVASITRLAGFASLALNHRDAAEQARARIWADLPKEISAPVLWHAPEQTDRESPAEKKTGAMVQESPQIHTCSSCGFPVSAGRNLCVECEQKSYAPAPTTSELFSMQKHENWLGEHGYTIAAIIVSAITAAVIFWLHR